MEPGAQSPSPERLLSAADPLQESLAAGIDGYERFALRQIVETAEVERAGGKTFLTACVSSALLDVLAAFEAGHEDLEDDNEDLEHDGREPQGDREPTGAEDDFLAPWNAWAYRS